MAHAPNRTALMLLGLGILLLGVVIGHVIPSEFVRIGLDTRERGQYRYVSPLLECAELHNLTPGEVWGLREDAEKFISRQKEQGKASEVAVYFRDLNNGPWFGINDETTFTPGSLTKVPLMMSLYREEEQDQGFLDHPVVYTESAGYATPTIVGSSSLVAGKEYPLSEIMRVMIVSSDNAAAETAFGALGGDALNETFTDLGLAPLPIDRDYGITVRHYASFFRILFNATYLSSEHSEQALAILAETEFVDGIKAGVPASVPVAHKFGEREVGSEVQLHDCGIVYVPGRPYTLCIMTRGTDTGTLAGTIRELSRLSYEAMSS